MGWFEAEIGGCFFNQPQQFQHATNPINLEAEVVQVHWRRWWGDKRMCFLKD
jgi:hypothetical protein